MSRPIRIAYVLASLRPGGAERQMLLLAEHLPKDRYEIEFLSLIGSGPYDHRARSAGANVIGLGAPPAMDESAGAGVVRRAAMVRRLLRVLRHREYDVIDAWLYPADVLAALMGPLANRPVIVTGRRNLGTHDRFGPFSAVVDRTIDRLTDAVVANSDAAARHAIRYHHVDPAKLRIIRNGVSPIEPPSEGERQRLRSEMGAGPGETLIGCVGNLRPVKRHDLLIEAFATLAAHSDETRMVFIGDGPMRREIERSLSDRGLSKIVRVLGPVLDVRPYYSAFDVVVQASDSEGLPNVLLEAAAAGRAIVATDAGGSREIVIDGRTGILVPTDEAAVLASGMRRLVEDADLRVHLGQAASRHVSQAFGVDRLAREVGDLYSQLVSMREPPGRRRSAFVGRRR